MSASLMRLSASLPPVVDVVDLPAEGRQGRGAETAVEHGVADVATLLGARVGLVVVGVELPDAVGPHLTCPRVGDA